MESHTFIQVQLQHLFHACLMCSCPVWYATKKIEIPVQYVSVSTTFQVRSKHGLPAVSGQNAEIGDWRI